MESTDSKKIPVPVETTDVTGMPNRRGFLGGLGALGFAAVAGVAAKSADATSLQVASTPQIQLSSIDRVNILREESYDVPGGKEHILQYTVSDDKGATLRHSSNVARIDAPNSYTTTSSFRVEEFAPGRDLKQTPTSLRSFQITAFAIKGDVIGNRRHDTVTTTIVAEDGTVHRQTQVVPVRLDMSEFVGLDTKALITKMGNIHLGKERLSS